MKRFFILIALIALSLSIYGCGGGSGSANLPGGENPGIPSVVQLMPSHFIAQTNGCCITLNVKVLDGNGAPVKAAPVTFTNLSYPLGELRYTCSPGSGIVNSPINTDNWGIARAYVLSTTPGFATILAQVYTGAGQVRDRKSVYFTTRDVLAVTMGMDVDSVPPTNPPNQLSDFTLFENSNDDTVKITATVRNAGGVAVGDGMSVLWSRSHTEATWDRTDPYTNVFGQAEAIVKVEPASIRDTETFVNIMAFAGNGAANMVTLFLRSVVPDPATSSLTANPSAVEPNKESTISAVVMLNTGSRAPNGTVVNFSVMPKTAGDPTPCGVVTPFAQTTGGIAQATFTAPPIPGTCTVTGKVAGVTIGTVDILVTTALTVIPSEATVNGTTGGTALFTIFGGMPAYTVLSSDSSLLPSPASVASSGGTFSVIVPAATAAKTVTYTIRDKAGTTVTAKLTITAAGGGGAALTISPSSTTVTAGGAATFVITGGTASYTVTSSHPSIAYNTAPGNGSWTVSASGGTFIVNTLAGLSSSATVTLTVVDSASNIVTATLTIEPSTAAALTLTPTSVSLTGLPEPNTADDIVFRITGGTAPYTMFSNNNAVIPSLGAFAGSTFTVDPAPVTSNTDVIITVVDSAGGSKTATVKVTPVSPAIAINPSAISMTAGDSAIFYVLGGTGGRLTISSGASNVTLAGCPGTSTLLNCPAVTTQFTVIADSASTTPTLITVIDIDGGTFATSSVLVNP